MCLFDDLADLRATTAELAADADAAYEAYADGTGDFGDRCYWEDRARDSALELVRTEVLAAFEFLALEA
jgi:hypothetical protein